MIALALPTLQNAGLTVAAFVLAGVVGWLIWLAVRGLGYEPQPGDPWVDDLPTPKAGR